MEDIRDEDDTISVITDVTPDSVTSNKLGSYSHLTRPKYYSNIGNVAMAIKFG